MGSRAWPQPQHPQASSQDSDVRWDYPNSRSPQSPFEYQDQSASSLMHPNRMLMQPNKIGQAYNHSYSSLRPPAPQLPPPQFVDSPPAPQVGSIPTRKRDYQGSNFHLRPNPPPLSSGSEYSDAVRLSQENIATPQQPQQQQLSGSDEFFSAATTPTWTSATDCSKVDELATELQSEILGDLRPGPGYLADHYPGRLLLNGQMEIQGNGGGVTTLQGMGVRMGSGMDLGTGSNFSGDGGFIKVLDTATGKPLGDPQPNSATGLQLVHLLLACAEAVANEQMDLAHVVLAGLKSMLVPCTTTMQRLGSVLVDAIQARITKIAPTGHYKGIDHDADVAILDMLQSFSVVYEFTPFIKLPHLTLNQILLDAVEGEPHVHVIDLNTGWRGMQWPAFIQALALRPGGPPKLRITSIGISEDLDHWRESLLDYAHNLHFPLEFCPLVVDLRSFDVRMLEIRDWEVVCINSVNQLHPLLTWGDERIHKFLCDLRSLQPRVMVYTENDAEHNSPTFLHRFFECLRYYSAVYDALDASLPRGSRAMQQVEHIFTRQKIHNIVACEGEERVTRHESLSKWSRRMEMAGFRSKSISTRAISQARLLLQLYFPQTGYTLRTENSAVVLGWDNMGIVGATAWRA